MRSFSVTNEMGILKFLRVVVCLGPLFELRQLVRGGSFFRSELVPMRRRRHLILLSLESGALLGDRIGLRGWGRFLFCCPLLGRLLLPLPQLLGRQLLSLLLLDEGLSLPQVPHSYASFFHAHGVVLAKALPPAVFVAKRGQSAAVIFDNRQGCFRR